MKINKIELKEYGPVKKFTLNPNNFELIFGLNESGKTAIVEALSYILFKNAECRYGRPEKIIIELKIGDRVYTLPAKRQPDQFPSVELSRLMYVSASDSEIYKRDKENRFWDSIKLQLSEGGGRVPFAKIISKIRDSCGLQAKMDDWKLEKKKALEQEIRRKMDIEKFIAEKNSIERKEKELIMLKEKWESCLRELENAQKCKRYSIYRELKGLYEEYLHAKSNISLYDRYEEKYLEEWQNLIAEKEGLRLMKENRDGINSEIEELKKKLNEVEKSERYLKEFGFEDYLSKLKETPAEPTLFFPLLFFLLGFLTLILSFKFGFTLFVPLSIFLLSIISLTIVYYKKMAIKRIEFEKKDWLNKAKILFPEINDIKEIKTKLEQVSNEHIKIKAFLDAKMEELKKTEDLKSLPDIEKGIEELRQKTGCAEIGQLKKKLEEKDELKKRIESISARIYGILGVKDMDRWPGLIEEMKTEPPKREYDTTNLEGVESKVKNLEGKIMEIENEIRYFKEYTMKHFNVENEWAVFDEYKKIEESLRNYELKKLAAKKAEEILISMSKELDIFIEDILKGENSLSEYFQFVTQRYNQVKVVDNDFIVIDEKGNEFYSDKLSSGAKDQLMLCFRFAAVKKLSPKGCFFILDDAFIFADYERRRRLVELLKRISQEQNQIIYFTSDEHTKELFSSYGARITEL